MMIILGTPSQPKDSPENFAPTKMVMAVKPISKIPAIDDLICPILASLRTGVRRCTTSTTARIRRLKMQLPIRVPIARSGTLTRATALIPVVSSGMEVIKARSTKPIHSLPKPVLSAITSPYRASLVPANRMMARQTTNFTQTQRTKKLKLPVRYLTNIIPYSGTKYEAPFNFDTICITILT